MRSIVELALGTAVYTVFTVQALRAKSVLWRVVAGTTAAAGVVYALVPRARKKINRMASRVCRILFFGSDAVAYIDMVDEETIDDIMSSMMSALERHKEMASVGAVEVIQGQEDAIVRALGAEHAHGDDSDAESLCKTEPNSRADSECSVESMEVDLFCGEILSPYIGESDGAAEETSCISLNESTLIGLLECPEDSAKRARPEASLFEADSLTDALLN